MSDDASDLFFPLQEELLRLHAEGRAVDPEALAAAFGVSPDDVRRCQAAVRLLADAGQATPVHPPPVLPPDYEVLDEIGRGGMGIVYRVRQRSLDRLVAVKVLRGDDAALRDGLVRFRKEARSLARLRHPHIVAIHEIGETDGAVFYSMDLIVGAPLSALVRAGSVTPTRAVHLLRQVASAVAFSHAHGVVHRDLKPANVLVDARGDAFVADFGLARDAVAGADVTVSGQILGTPAYMSPEQALGQGDRVGERSDVYALGAVLYECLTGRPPFAGRTLAEVVLAVVHDDPPAPRRLQPTVPRELELVCRKAMAKRPEDRYPTANAMLEDLERFHDGRPLRARPPSWRYRVGRWLRRHGRPIGLGLAAAAALIAAYVFAVAPRLDPPAAQTLRAARELLAAAQAPAALVLLDKAATQEGFDRLRPAIDGARVEAHLRTMAVADDAGEAAFMAALEQLRAAAQLAPSANPADADHLIAAAWQLAGKAARRGVGACVDGVAEVVARALAVRRVLARPDLPGMLALAFGSTRANDEVLAFLWPALGDAGDPLRLAAARVVASVLSLENSRSWGRPPRTSGEGVVETDFLGSHAPHGPLTASVRAHAARDPRLLVPLLEELDRVDAATASERFRPFLGEGEFGPLAPAWLRPQALQQVLSLAESSGAGPGRAQAAAAELLAVAHDLPLRMRVAGAAAPAPDAARVAAILAQVRALADLPPLEAYRRKVGDAVAALETASADEFAFLTRWLAEHTQADLPLTSRRTAKLQGWHAWWQEHGGADPRAWLVRPLGLADLPAVGAATALLPRYLRAPPRERAAWHHLLTLTLPSSLGGVPPCRPWPDREPDEAPMVWWHLLGATDHPDTFAGRVACLRWRDGASEPTIAFQAQRLLTLGEVWRVEADGSLPWPPIVCASPRIPGVAAGASYARGTWSLRYPAWCVAWTPAGRLQLVAGGDDAAWSASHPHVGHRGTSAGVYRVDEGTVAVLLEHDLAPWQDAGVAGAQVLCAVFQRADVEPAPWRLADWRAAVARSASGLGDGFWRGATGLVDHGRVGAAANAVELARWLPTPEARDDLVRLTTSIPGFSPPGCDEFSRCITRARLLLGDAAVLDAPDLAARVPVVRADDMAAAADTRFWARVWLRSDDARLRRLAETRMHAAKLSPSLAAALVAAGMVPQEAELRGALADGGAALRRVRYWSAPSILWATGLALGAALLALVASVRTRGRAVAAFGLLASGVAVASTQIWVGGVPVLPRAVGALLAGAGSLLLARRAAGGARWLTPGALVAATVCAGVAEVGVAPDALFPAATGAWLVAILGLPLLAAGLRSRPPRWRWLAWGLALVVYGAYGVTALRLFYGDIGARVLLGLPAHVVIGAPSWWAWCQAWPAVVGLAAALALVALRLPRPADRAPAR